MADFFNDPVESQNNLDSLKITNTKKLWNPVIFIVFSVIFSFLPASIMYSLNIGRLGHIKKRNLNIGIFIALFIILISLVFLTGDFINGGLLKAIFSVLNIGLGIYMYKKQKDMYDEHIKNGGEKASVVIPTIICIVSCVLFLAILIIGVLMHTK